VWSAEAHRFIRHEGVLTVPVHKTSDGGYQWGRHGKVYRGDGAAAKAAEQGRAAFANGYRSPRVKKLARRIKAK
jgi:hypothetical protein